MATDRTSDYQRAVDADPELQGLFAQLRASGGSGSLLGGQSPSTALTQAIRSRLQTVIPGGLPTDYAFTPTGQITRTNAIGRNADTIAGGVLAAMGLGYLATRGGGNNHTSTTPPGQTPPPPPPPPGGGGNILSNPDFWATIAGVGTNLYNTHAQLSAAEKAAQLQADAAKAASDQQAAALQKAIDLQKQMYEQDRADAAPYRGAGQGAVGRLSYLLGIPGFESGPQAFQPQAQQGPAGSSGGSLSSLTGPMGQVTPTPPPAPTPTTLSGPMGQVTPQATQEPSVTLQAPDGSTKVVPQSQADRYLSRGARRVA